MVLFSYKQGMIFILLLLAPGLAWAGQNNSLYSRGYLDKAAGSDSSSSPGSASPAGGDRRGGANNNAGEGMFSRNRSIYRASWFAVEEPSPKDYRVHDLVTIIVNEVSKHTTKEDTKADRDYQLDMAIKDWIRLTGGNLRPDKQLHGDPKIGVSMEKGFEGKSDIKREDTLVARIQAEIIDIKPNGNLLLEATHRVTTNEETTIITLTGTCRSKDVGVDNTIVSSQIAKLEISKQSSGIARDANKRGLLSGLWDWIALF